MFTSSFLLLCFQSRHFIFKNLFLRNGISMSRFALWLISVTTTLFVVCHSAPTDFDYGIEMSTKAAQAACIYEYAKPIPPYPVQPETKGKQRLNICYPSLNIPIFLESHDGQERLEEAQNELREKLSLVLPGKSGYAEACLQFVEEPAKSPAAINKELRDQGGNYPLKGFAHCMISKIKERHGSKAAAGLDERWRSSSGGPWREILLERHNELRARHGAPKLKLDDELSKKAQTWADGLAKTCGENVHIDDNHPDAKYKDQPTGENLARSDSGYLSEDNALIAAKGWYDEVKDYPYPAYNGKEISEEIRHFTAIVWKATELVGFGIGRRQGCNRVYVVGRYWKAGNVEGEYGKNVGVAQR